MLRLWRTLLKARGPRQSPDLPIASAGTAARFINNYPIMFGHKYWSNHWWPADLQGPFCKNRSFMQVCFVQHQKDQALPNGACCTISSRPRPLSFLGWTTAVLSWLDFHQTQSNLYNWFRMQQHDWSSTSPKGPTSHLFYLPAEATGCGSHQVQDIDACILNSHRLRLSTRLLPLTLESTSPPEAWVSEALWNHHRERQNHLLLMNYVWCSVVVFFLVLILTRFSEI